MQDPEIYLEAIGVTLACPVHRDRDAVLDASHRTRIGHEVFLFSSPEALAEFQRRPLRYIDVLTDPVSLDRFTPTEHSPRLAHADRTYYFADARTLITFRTDPDRYADPTLEMR